MDANKTWGMTQAMMAGDFNPNHDPDDGRFTSGSGSTGGGSGERLGMTALREAKIGTRVITGTGKIYEKTDDKDLPWHNIEDRHGDKASSTYLAQSREPGGVTLYKGGSVSGSKLLTAKDLPVGKNDKDVDSSSIKINKKNPVVLGTGKRGLEIARQQLGEGFVAQKLSGGTEAYGKYASRVDGKKHMLYHAEAGGDMYLLAKNENVLKTLTAHDSAAWDITERMMVGDFNPNHDPDDGRFTSGSGGGSGSWKPDDIYNDKGFVGHRYIENQAEEFLELHLPDNDEELDTIFESRVVGKPDETGRADVEVDYRVRTASGRLEERTSTINALVSSTKARGSSLKSASGGKMKDPAGYFNQASKMSGLKPVLAQMDKASKDNVAKAVYRAAASPDGRDATLSFGRKSVKVTTPSKDKHVAKEYGIHWTDRRGIPNASMHGEAKDLATHLLITLKDLGYNGEQITIK